MKPATPLPWIAEEFKVVSSNSKFMAAECHAMNSEPDFGAKTNLTDAAYIVHAANNYPRLMEALRQLVTHMDAIVPATKQKAREDARALLRELGED